MDQLTVSKTIEKDSRHNISHFYLPIRTEYNKVLKKTRFLT